MARAGLGGRADQPAGVARRRQCRPAGREHLFPRRHSTGGRWLDPSTAGPHPAGRHPVRARHGGHEGHHRRGARRVARARPGRNGRRLRARAALLHRRGRRPVSRHPPSCRAGAGAGTSAELQRRRGAAHLGRLLRQLRPPRARPRPRRAFRRSGGRRERDRGSAADAGGLVGPQTARAGPHLRPRATAALPGPALDRPAEHRGRAWRPEGFRAAGELRDPAQPPLHARGEFRRRAGRDHDGRAGA